MASPPDPRPRHRRLLATGSLLLLALLLVARILLDARPATLPLLAPFGVLCGAGLCLLFVGSGERHRRWIFFALCVAAILVVDVEGRRDLRAGEAAIGSRLLRITPIGSGRRDVDQFLLLLSHRHGETGAAHPLAESDARRLVPEGGSVRVVVLGGYGTIVPTDVEACYAFDRAGKLVALRVSKYREVP